jgi:hypothetical protein
VTLLHKHGQNVVLIGRETRILTAQDLLNLMMTAWYEHSCSGLIVYKESLSDSFFDLKTGVAGELLQKCSNYRMKFAIVGDFSAVSSKSLRDFIYECNKGRLVFFKHDVESALEALSTVS